MKAAAISAIVVGASFVITTNVKVTFAHSSGSQQSQSPQSAEALKGKDQPPAAPSGSQQSQSPLTTRPGVPATAPASNGVMESCSPADNDPVAGWVYVGTDGEGFILICKSTYTAQVCIFEQGSFFSGFSAKTYKSTSFKGELPVKAKYPPAKATEEKKANEEKKGAGSPTPSWATEYTGYIFEISSDSNIKKLLFVSSMPLGDGRFPAAIREAQAAEYIHLGYFRRALFIHEKR